MRPALVSNTQSPAIRRPFLTAVQEVRMRIFVFAFVTSGRFFALSPEALIIVVAIITTTTTAGTATSA
jgi:hypothetical protein